MTAKRSVLNHIVLTSHPGSFAQQSLPIVWGHHEPLQRGPIIATLTHAEHRNAIGTHAGSYAIYRALAVAKGLLGTQHRPDFTDTTPAETIGPHARLTSLCRAQAWRSRRG